MLQKKDPGSPTQRIVELFETGDEVVSIEMFGQGRINDTFKVTGMNHIYVLQRINTTVFPEPEHIMQNINTITNHIAKKRPDKPNLRVIPTQEGKLGYSEGNDYWRLYNYLDHTRTLDVIATTQDAYAAAKGFGDFLYLLSDLDPHLIKPVLPDFHNVPYRIKQLEQAIREDRAGRYQKVQDLCKQVRKYEPEIIRIYQLIDNGAVPVRITHNDTKISNVLLDETTLEPLVVIDLDTVMPGSVLFDLGDMIRTFLSPVDENEADLSKVQIRSEMLEALISGYHKGSKYMLTEMEKELVIDAGKMLSFTQTIRFLTDYLNGDLYYKIDYSDQNLIRAKNQLTLLSLLIKEEKTWKSIAREIFSSSLH